MSDKTQVMTSAEHISIPGKFANVFQSRGLSLVRFYSVAQARHALGREDILLVFCASRLVDGTYEDVLAAARKVGSRIKIVITPSESDAFEPVLYERARNLGAFDVLRRFYGPKDVEWIVTCALREENPAREAATWHGYQ